MKDTEFKEGDKVTALDTLKDGFQCAIYCYRAKVQSLVDGKVVDGERHIVRTGGWLHSVRNVKAGW